MTDQPQPQTQSDTPSPDDEPIEPFVLTLPDEPGSHSDWYLWVVVLSLLTVVVFSRMFGGGFIWDDDHYVTQNLSLQSFEGLVHLWIAPIGAYANIDTLRTIQYYPLLYTMLWVEHHFFGDEAMGYHVVNLLLHAGAAIVLWRALRRLQLPGAWVIAAMWAVHPLQAESVCWISEGKNILSGLLTFAALLFYLEFCGFASTQRDPNKPLLITSGQAYMLSLVLFIAALLAKTVAISLVPALFVILWWKGRLKRGWVGLVPMFLIGLALSAITAHRETDPNGPVRAYGPAWHLSFIQHILLPARDFWFYIEKLIAPVNLSFNYPRIVPGASDPLSWLMLIGALAVLWILFAAREKIGRGPFTAFMCYVFALLPSMGFANVYPFRFSYVADHFAYLAILPLIALVVSAVAERMPHIEVEPGASPLTRWPAILAALPVLLLAGVSWARSEAFVDSGSLWSDTLDKNPNSWLAAYNLARGEVSDSDQSLHDAMVAHQNDDSDTEKSASDNAVALLDDAQKLLQGVLDNPQTPPDVHYEAYDELGSIALRRVAWHGDQVMELAEQAKADVQHAIDEEQPLDAQTPDALPYLNLGKILALEADQLKKAIPALATTNPSTEPTASTGPSNATTEASATTQPTSRPATPQEEAAIDQYQAARNALIQAKERAERARQIPNLAREAEHLYGLIADATGNADFSVASLENLRHDRPLELGYLNEAISAYAAAIEEDPSDPDTHFKLARCYEAFNMWDEAVQQLTMAVQATPPPHADPAAFFELGYIHLTHQRKDYVLDDLVVARTCFKAVLDIDPNYPEAKDMLADVDRTIDLYRASTRASTGPATGP
ncbi:MAG: tetratricopeptide repeat protein [Tepidisphaeraceae bacterium]|jgi:tetratricopeptide (TPR) repeat protein